MPVRMNPSIGDCSSYNTLNCAPSYKHGDLVPDAEDEYFDSDFVIPPPESPQLSPEQHPDYLAALRIYEQTLRVREESITIYELVYWTRLKRNVINMVDSWGGWVLTKALVLGNHLAASVLIGAIFLGAVLVFMHFAGPFRMKTLGVWMVAFVIGSIVVTENVEMAATSIIGAILLIILFFTRMTTGSRVLTVRNRSVKTKVSEDCVHLFIDFWYCGERSLWINLSDKNIGVL